jgi:enoyl-CoA hydratase
LGDIFLMSLVEKTNILSEIVKDQLVIRFNRPEIRNPLSIEVLEELRKILDDAAGQKDIRNIMFTGAEGIFASGANLNEIAKVTAETAPEFALRGQALMNMIARAPQKTIAAINGYCFGGALDLALACNVRIAAPNAEFCHPGVGLGIITGWGGTQLLPRLIGEAKALEMFLTARRVGAQEALAIGLVDRISDKPADEEDF